ncbi:ABC-type Zn uptake system ZnuABC, Zn-binding component ZnuA [Phyllobacterium sp. CL33Tsu]|uniref:hypothetical protein n=1 Tax=Phyllobacterium sp. CL33Tsu TaxID=1798191 RepID=UPI0008E2158C|nr:hypothetical protein [Phyllobacterium sp. CL33Tsu]SFJ54210.1 ABC-type Zn uptake system ZnuABC, Zn-binding component ZnuA [Phyllobacterium sp. CL33Tsu]
METTKTAQKPAATAKLTRGPSTTYPAAEPKTLKTDTTYTRTSDIPKKTADNTSNMTTLARPHSQAQTEEPKPAKADAPTNEDVLKAKTRQPEAFLTRPGDASATKTPRREPSKAGKPTKRTQDQQNQEEASGTQHEEQEAFQPHATQATTNANTYPKNTIKPTAKPDEAKPQTKKTNATPQTAKHDTTETQHKTATTTSPETNNLANTPQQTIPQSQKKDTLTSRNPEGIATQHEATHTDRSKQNKQTKQDKAKPTLKENTNNQPRSQKSTNETKNKGGGTR